MRIQWVLLVSSAVAAAACGPEPAPQNVACALPNEAGVDAANSDSAAEPLPTASAAPEVADSGSVAPLPQIGDAAVAATDAAKAIDPDESKKYRIIVADDFPHMPGKARKPPKPKKTAKQLEEEEEERAQASAAKKSAGKKKKKKKKKNITLIDKDLLGDEEKPKAPKPKSHPEPRIIVDVLKTEGELGTGELQKLIRARSYGAIRNCYEEGLRRDQVLRGVVTFELRLATSGKAETIIRKDNLLKDESVAWCIGREMLRTGYPKEDAGHTLATVRVQLGPGDEQVASFQKHRKFEKLRELLKEKFTDFEGCYRPSVEDDRTIGGAMSLRVRVLLNGEVERVDEFQTNFRDKEVTKCMIEIVKKVKFPRMSRREPAFIYPLHFEAVEE